MILLKGNNADFGIKVPTSLGEISPEILKGISNNINLPKYYCIVGLAYKASLFEVASSINNKKNISISVNPILVKISEEDSKEMNAKVGEKIIINRSSLELGSTINLNTNITSNAIRRYIATHEEILNAIIRKDYNTITDDISRDDIARAIEKKISIYMMEFKVVPIRDIVASISNKSTTDFFTEHYVDIPVC